jgi:hypothetical protein
MKRILLLTWAVLALDLLAGCCTANPGGSASSEGPRISGYVGTSAQTRF